MIWKYKGIKVYYKRRLNGGGTILARPCLEFIKNHSTLNKNYSRAFEWCSGPGFIGFALLAEGICNTLVLADINPLAIDCVEKTVRKNHLEDKVSYSVSDNLKAIPKNEKFDLVVSNPPNYFNINPKHRFGPLFRADKRPFDSEWKIHREFYSNIKKHLNQGAQLMISEVEPFKTKVFIPASSKVPYDIRKQQPINDFKKMISDGGLSYVATQQYLDYYGLGLWMIVSRR